MQDQHIHTHNRSIQIALALLVICFILLAGLAWAYIQGQIGSLAGKQAAADVSLDARHIIASDGLEVKNGKVRLPANSIHYNTLDSTVQTWVSNVVRTQITNNNLTLQRSTPPATTILQTLPTEIISEVTTILDELQAGEITSDLLASAAVTTDKLADGVITTLKIADAIADFAIDTQHLANNAVTGLQLANGAVTTAALAANSIGAANIIDGTIGGGDIGAGTITSGLLAAGAVTTAALADNAVTNVAIADNAATGHTMLAAVCSPV